MRTRSPRRVTRPWGIRNRVSIQVTILFGTLLAGAAFWLLRLGEDDVRDGISLQQSALVKTLAHGFDLQLAARHDALKKVAGSLPLALLDQGGQLQKYLDERLILPTMFSNVLVYGPDGVVLAAAPSPERYVGKDLGHLEYIVRTLQTRQPTISKPFVSPVSGEPLVVMTAPVLDQQGRLRAILGGSQYLLRDNLFAGFTANRFGKAGVLLLLTRDRVMIGHPDKSRLMEFLMPGQNLGVDSALEAGTFVGETVSSRGVPGLMAIETLQTTGWLAGVFLPLSEAYQPIASMRRNALRLIVALELLLPLMVWLAMGYFTRPLLRLRDRIEEMARAPDQAGLLGDGGDDEIGDMARAFDGLTSARRRAELELRKLSQAVEQSANVIMITDLAGVIEYANPTFTRSTGYALEEAVGKHTQMLRSSDAQPEVYRRLWATILAGERWQGMLCNTKKNGEPLWVSASISPIRDHAGNITNFVMVEEDITELREAEAARARLEEQLLHSQRLDAVGRLAGGVAHDFNNLLCAIVFGGQSLLENLDAADPRRVEVGEILQAAQRATALARSLLVFSRKANAELKPTAITELIERIQKLVLRLLGANIEIRLALCEQPLAVRGDVGQLEQVLTNLATNARDAMPEGGVLTIGTGTAALDAASARALGCAEGRYAVITVTDTGTGMAPGTRERIFEPFFSTKGPLQGTGLGLSIAYGIVHAHGGGIECRSQLGEGTTFTLYLPLYQGAVEAESEDRLLDAVGGGHETVLVAEDDPTIRAQVRRILEKHGYDVLEAADGAEALLRFQEVPDRIRLVLVDGVMPNLSGTAAVRAMRLTRPDLKALLLTGYTGAVGTRPGLDADGLPSLHKPVTPRALLLRVRELLDGPLEQARPAPVTQSS